MEELSLGQQEPYAEGSSGHRAASKGSNKDEMATPEGKEKEKWAGRTD